MARVYKQEGITIVEIDAEYDSLDIVKLNDLGQVLLGAVAQADPPKVLLDMGRTTFIGSHFLGLLIRAWKRLRDRHGELAVCHVNEVCGDVLRASKLDMIWQIFPDRDTGVARLRQPL
ncbi:MAG TPA: STAS domain-containing protein [Pirellulales bacterium]|nr:STAS domain-containing protein [Pirellulales bacterium]